LLNSNRLLDVKNIEMWDNKYPGINLAITKCYDNDIEKNNK